jgi:hypothetical protein
MQESDLQGIEKEPRSFVSLLFVATLTGPPCPKR